MESVNELILNTEQRAAAVAKLFQLIEMDTEIIEQYRAAGINDANVRQYVDKRNENLQKLSQLLDAPKLKIHLSFDKAA
ncbi:MAG: hypothetical protein U0X91_07220 [Spirosomataceae bacterium]